jgi:hypothetical protein
MFYVKLHDDGEVDKYPYTLTDLRLDNPRVSFTEVITDEVAAAFSVFPVQSSEPPVVSYEYDLQRHAELVDGEWHEIWSTVAVSPQVAQQRTTDQASAVRSQRNQLLTESDWTQLVDAQVDATVWATYRQQLRDISVQAGFPWETTWPTKPYQL